MVQFTEEDSNLSGYNQVIKHNGILCRIGVIGSMITQMYALVKKI